MNQETEKEQRAAEVLRMMKTFALIGATQDMLKYSYELMFTLIDAGYKVYPINPRYEKIEEEKCYPSLTELPEEPEVVIMVLSPQNVERVVGEIRCPKPKLLWLPPGSWSEAAVKKARLLGMEVLYDVCPVGILRKIRKG